MSVKDLLKKSLPRRLHAKIPASFDIIGSKEKAVAIIEIPKEMQKYRTRIAAAVMQQHKNVKSVLEKGTPRKGAYRLRDYRVIKGDKNTEVIHSETGCRFVVDPQKTYFSQREGTERQRIASLVRNGETVMVFFAGAGPFPIILSKKTEAKRIIGIEINPAAAEYFRKNVALNKCRNVEVMEGDVAAESKNYIGSCDRIVMPLPEKSVDYVPDAIACAKQGGIIHLYLFSTELGLAAVKSNIRKIARKSGKKLGFLGKTNVLPYGPGIWKMRLNIRVL